MELVHQMFLRQCRQRWRTLKVADSLGTELTGGQLLVRTLVLRRLLRRVLAPDEQYVGLLLPPSAAAFVANMAVTLDRRISANLNYSASSEVLNACIRLAGIRHVLTSRRFLEKMDFKLEAEWVLLEDLRDKLTLADQAAAWLLARLPSPWLSRCLKLNEVQPDDVLTVIFTSGSTGMPKGVLLTYRNVTSNVHAVDQIIRLRESDVLVGVLPFFHSFGYTVTLWAVASLNVAGVYHVSPLEPRQIGQLTQKYRGTLLLGTPTFLRSYLRRCDKEQFATLDVVVCGAEKLPRELADEFERKFGIRPMEGYGTTELSPVVSVNIPPSRSPGTGQPERKEGSVGRPLPGVRIKITDLETGQELPPGKPGMIWVSGPNVMKGYLNQPDKTAQVLKDGWYQTGDVGYVDEDGFLFITGRESRFSKIGGEMVPHGLIEEHLERLIGPTEDGRPQVAVTGVPDPKKGERLIVLHTPLTKTPRELCQGLAEAGLPNLYIPSEDSFFEVPQLPLLGSGKLDLRGVKALAEERLARG